MKSLGPGRNLAGLAVRTEVLKDANAVAGRALVLGRPLMGVVLDDPDSAALIHGNAGRRDDVRFGSDQLNEEPFVRGRGRSGGRHGNAADQGEPTNQADQEPHINSPDRAS